MAGEPRQEGARAGGHRQVDAPTPLPALHSVAQTFATLLWTTPHQLGFNRTRADRVVSTQFIVLVTLRVTRRGSRLLS